MGLFSKRLWFGRMVEDAILIWMGKCFLVEGL